MVIGGGAHGLGVALDAALRGYRTVLFERGDFGGETSSRSTKLIHGGVRYLAQGRIGLVREASRERALLLASAPSLVRPLPFLVPASSRREALRLRAGLWLYDRIGGDAQGRPQRRGRGDPGHARSRPPGPEDEHPVVGSDGPTPPTRQRSRGLDAAAARSVWPALPVRGCVGAVTFEDAQFDDARFAVSLATAAVAAGAVVRNYAEVIALERAGQGGDAGRVVGVVVRDLETGAESAVTARVVVDATGAFGAETRALGSRGPSPEAARVGRGPSLAYSRGSHIVLAPRFVCSDHALLVPRTEDGRVVFAIPFLGHLLVGTTDVPVEGPVRAPGPSAEEVDFLLRHIRPYLAAEPTRADITSVWAGLRVLAKGRHRAGDGSAAASGPAGSTGPGAAASTTADISRERLILETRPGLLSVIGGKWTTYRATAEQVVDRAARIAGLHSSDCRTRGLRLVDPAVGLTGAASAGRSGWDAAEPGLQCDEALVAHAARSGPLACDAAFVAHAACVEMARRAEDILARRTRILFVDARRARELAGPVARWLGEALGRDETWVEAETLAMEALAETYLPE